MGRHTTRPGASSRAEARPPLPYPVRDGRVPPTVQAVRERRAQRRKSRLAALSAASMLAVGGAAGMSMATADEPEASGGDTIVFSGDCGALDLISATSNPDTSEITVTEGSQVRYTNALGASAELHVGTESYEIGAGSTQVFVMNQSAEVAMVPDCHGLFAQYGSVQVNVVDAPAPAPEEQDSPDDSGSGSDTGRLPSAGSDSGSDSGGDADARSGGAETDGGSTGSTGSSGSDGSIGSSWQGAASGSRAEEEAAEAEVTEDTDAETEVEAEEEEVNSFGSNTGGSWDDSEFSPAGSDEVVAVDPEAVSDGASGLLALVAIVCLVGVSAAVMRTILKQRATA